MCAVVLMFLFFVSHSCVCKRSRSYEGQPVIRTTIPRKCLSYIQAPCDDARVSLIPCLGVFTRLTCSVYHVQQLSCAMYNSLACRHNFSVIILYASLRPPPAAFSAASCARGVFALAAASRSSNAIPRSCASAPAAAQGACHPERAVKRTHVLDD